MAEIIEFLSPDWIIEQIKENPKPLTPLGEFVYYRTYSRWQEKVGRREYWHETLKRTIEYSLSLEHAHMKDIDLKPDINRMKKEAKKLFLNFYYIYKKHSYLYN